MAGTMVMDPVSGPYKICEGVAGVWHYHLCRATSNGCRSLCGKATMPTECPLDPWGYMPEHMPTSYCQKCHDLAIEGEDG